MWFWLKTALLYILLLLCRPHYWHDDFTERLARPCKKRRNRKRVAGIREELDELVDLPNGISDDHTFTGISRDGIVAYFRSHRQRNGHVRTDVALEIPGTGRFTFSEVRPGQACGGGLQLQMQEPMRRWKVYYRGPLQPVSSDTDAEPIHAYLSFYWECLADPFSYWSNVSFWQMAKSVAANGLFDAVQTVTSWHDRAGYEQWGEMRGRIEVAGFADTNVILKTTRSRSFRADISESERVDLEHLVADDGSLYISAGIVCDNRSARTIGYVTYPIGERFGLSDLTTEDNPGDRLSLNHPFHIQANDRNFTIETECQKTVPLCFGHFCETDTLTFGNFTINNKNAFGIRVCRQHNVTERTADNVRMTPIQQDTSIASPWTVTIQADECSVASLVGGKGAQLAVLRRLNQNVPKAFCITTVAYEHHIDSHSDLKETIREIKNAVRNRYKTLAVVCDRTAKICRNTRLTSPMEETLRGQLINTFGPSYEKMRFAIRSSGVSEDSSEASAAGQMETILGTRSFDQIASAICKCWASSLAYQVVEYRRQNGQPVIEPMAVVVQEMVDADVAGVLFTNDPVNGNTSTMVINAAPGLGEAVVSGQSTPDTIRVERRKSGQELRITEVTVGTRKTKIVMSDEGGIQNVDNRTNELEPCLNNDQIVGLCEIGLEIEKALCNPQDIEWAISDGRVFLLQTRPITSFDLETDEELIHEFDSPVAMDTAECITTCNIGEMLPGVATPLTRTMYFRVLGDCVEWMYRRRHGIAIPKFATKGCLGFANRGFFNMTQIISPLVSSQAKNKNNIEIFMLGESVPYHTVDTLQLYAGRRIPFLTGWMRFFYSRLHLYPSQTGKFDKWRSDIDDWHVGDNCVDSITLYQEIDDNLHFLFDAWRANSFKISKATVWSGVLMGLLKGKSQEMTAEHNADLSILLASCKNVHSADVPTAVQGLARDIAESNMKGQFMTLDDTECHSLLMNASDTIREKYQRFLKTHGHRCIREIEFSVKSWEMDATDLMHTLKLLIRTGSYNAQPQKDVSPKEAVSLLKTPLSPLKRYLLEKLLVPKARHGVTEREIGKSICVKTGHILKKAYWRLADMMVRESRIPDDELLFYLTHYEIGTLLETRSPALIRKAKRRMRVMTKQEALRFPKMNIGRPTPLPETMERESDISSMFLKGMTVGKGTAKGRACVIMDVRDADNIQKGDILICPFTDIGWTPYFSMISGLVTEMGGLLSHGSVVAREVGIPCVVNVKDATWKLRTGDIVRIDGLKGTITKLDSEQGGSLNGGFK